MFSERGVGLAACWKQQTRHLTELGHISIDTEQNTVARAIPNSNKWCKNPAFRLLCPRYRLSSWRKPRGGFQLPGAQKRADETVSEPYCSLWKGVCSILNQTDAVNDLKRNQATQRVWNLTGFCWFSHDKCGATNNLCLTAITVCQMFNFQPWANNLGPMEFQI